MDQIKQFPDFKIIPSEIPQTYRNYMSKIDEAYIKMLKIENPDWNSTDIVKNIETAFGQYVGQVYHLISVKSVDQSYREAHESMIQELSDFDAKWSQSKELFDFYKKIGKTELNDIQARIIKRTLLSFKNSGIDLSPEDQEKYNKISSSLSKLSLKYSGNLQQSSDEINIDLKDDSRLGGFLDDTIERFKSQAEDLEGVEYRILTNSSDYMDVLSYATDESLRKEVYFNNLGIASSSLQGGKYDNEPLMKEILKLRQEMAELLGYNNYSEYSLSTKMAESPLQVINFLEDISEKAINQYKQESKELKDFAFDKKVTTNADELMPWNAGLASRLQREEKFNIEEDKVRAYFPISKVQEGLFWLIDEIFGYSVSEVDFEYDKYHDDLRLFQIKKDNDVKAYIYADLYARKGKDEGAWMDNYCDRSEQNVPVAFVVCNFTAPLKNKEATLTFDDVVTLFHEFGHALHHTLTTVEVEGAEGLHGVPWDAVELPSTFMEFFCYKPEMLDKISSHIKTKEKLPKDMIDSIIKSEQSNAAMGVMRQMELSFVDIQTHTNKEIDIASVAKDFRAKYEMPEMLEFTHFYNQFGHIFAGGYAAGYYSYKWADILASDIFETFDENGVFCKETGQRYLNTILSQGSSREILDMFRDFKGKEPNPEAFLRYAGIKV